MGSEMCIRDRVGIKCPRTFREAALDPKGKNYMADLENRFGYLKDGAALLEAALIQFVFEVLTDEKVISDIINTLKTKVPSKTFVPVFPPVMIKPEVFKKMARLSEEDKEERYYIPSDNLYLIGSAEHTLGAMHINELIPEEELPIRYLGFSTSFRREAGSYGKDTRGILRVHQFDKLEMESFTVGERAEAEQEFLVAVQEYLMQQLNLPYQVVMVCTGDMGKPDARQIDIEVWLPGQQRYRETHSADLMTDYQARRLNTRVCLLYTSPSPRDLSTSRMPSSA